MAKQNQTNRKSTKPKAAPAPKPSTTKRRARASKPVKIPATVVKLCCCGCGEIANKSFKPGHDARAHGLLLRVVRGKAPASDVKSELRREWRNIAFIQKEQQLRTLMQSLTKEAK